MQYIIGILLVFIIVTAGWLIFFYSKMANNKILVEDSWTQLDLQHTKRNDLILEYVDMVFGFEAYKQEILLQIIQARANLIDAKAAIDIMKFSQKISRLLERLFTVSEKCIVLKTEASFVLLEQQMRELEEKIEICRYIYNDTVSSYNKFLNIFPNNVCGMILGVEELPYFRLMRDKE
ncbi:MAG: hypothetical protein VR72_09290 [Clostridiaceae bacterium BRH_c20a]|nr:MAG: hypothetical protein VR72_09290 [Clostridiaceae bacterium BRH_c20a]